QPRLLLPSPPPTDQTSPAIPARKLYSSTGPPVRKKPLQSRRGRSKPSRVSESPKKSDICRLDANRRLQSILVANEIATWTWDVANNRVVADKNLARIFGVTAKDAAGGPIEKYIEAIHPDDRAHVSAAIAKTL